jgi:hypothetical protein
MQAAAAWRLVDELALFGLAAGLLDCAPGEGFNAFIEEDSSRT